jgi:hypothetical protein
MALTQTVLETHLEKTVSVSSNINIPQPNHTRNFSYSEVPQGSPVPESLRWLFYFLPRDVWKTNVCSFLDRRSLASLRLVCKWFRKEIVSYPVWKQRVPYSKYEGYLKKCKEFGWKEPQIFSIFFSYVDYYSFSKISFELLPSSFLQEIDISRCSQITDPDLNFLPDNLHRLVLPWTHQLTIVKLESLISSNVKLIFLDMKRVTSNVLYWACANESYQLASFCLLDDYKNLIDINEPNSLGLTPLFIASQKRYFPIAQLLLESECEVNRPAPDGKTPLMIATEWGYTEIVLLLLRYGADVNMKNKAGKTALNIAQQKRFLKIVKMLENPQAYLDD